jgi:hypothetical protein
VTDRYADLNPGAVTAALRSFPRRFRTTLAADPTKDRDEIAALRAPDGRSVREVLTSTVDSLARLGEVVRRVLVSEGTSVPAAALGGPTNGATGAGSGVDAASLSTVLDRLDDAASSVADPIAGASLAALLRTGTTPDGASITALDLARHAVRVGAENLRAAEKAMQAGGIELDVEGDNEG